MLWIIADFIGPSRTVFILVIRVLKIINFTLGIYLLKDNEL